MKTKAKNPQQSVHDGPAESCVRTTQDQETFAVLASDILAMLPFAGYSLLEIKNDKYAKEVRQKNRRDMVGMFTKSMQSLRRMQLEWDGMLDGVVKALVWKGSGDPALQLFHKLLEETRTAVPRPPLELADPLQVELMLGSDEDVKNALGAALQETVVRMTGGFYSGLQQMRQRELIGELEWSGQDVCKYHFYRVRRIEKKLGESTRSETERTTNAYMGEWHEHEHTYRINHIGRFDVIERHEHHLYNATRFQFPAATIRKPTFIKDFLAVVPSWVQKHVFISEGDMLREDVTKHERECERFDTEERLASRLVRSGRLWSPAVSIGSYVLTGWSTADLA